MGDSIIDTLEFVLWDDHIDKIIDWIDSYIPAIAKYQERDFPIFGMTIPIFILHIEPIGEDDWRTSITLLDGIFPKIPPLILTKGIALTNKLLPNNIYLKSPEKSRKRRYLARFRHVLHRLTISHGFYSHLQHLGWTMELVRDYEYIINPTTIGSNTRVRKLGNKEWITLEDPDFEP